MFSFTINFVITFLETLPSSEIVSLAKWSSLTILNEQEFDASSLPEKEGNLQFYVN